MGAKRRRVCDESDARRLLEDWAESGLDLPVFCARRGVDGRSLRRWHNQAGRARKVEPVSLRLMEVVGQASARKAEYRLVVGDLVIEVDDDFHDDTLGRLLRVAATC